MTPVIVKYPLDPTGVSPDNLVANEPHSLPNRSVRAIAPVYGAFFSASLVVKDKQNNRVLVNNLQYYAAELYAVPTAEFGKEVCAIILITDPNVSSNIDITYQAVGGQYSVSTQAIVSLLDSLNLDNRPVAWPNIINRPSQFPPAPHLHDIGDTYGWEDVVFAIDRLNAAIQLGDEIQHDEFYRYVDSKLAAFAPPNIPAIRTPINLTPTNGETDISAMPLFTFTPYYSLYGIPGDRVVAQIDTDPAFSNPRDSFTQSYGVYNAYQPNIPLDSLVTYYWRVAYIDIEGTQSEWSQPTAFTTLAVGIETPTIISPVDGATDVNDGITILSSPFTYIGPDDIHQASSWEIWDDPNFSINRVFFLEGSFTDLTSVTVPFGILEVSKDYYVRVRYFSLNYGYSLFSHLSKFTTSASFTFKGIPYGSPLAGGFYAGDLSVIRNTFEMGSRLPLTGTPDPANMDRYAIIIASKGVGEFNGRQLAPTNATFFATSALYDGLDNTSALVSNFPTLTNGAAQLTNNLVTGGFADWQIPTDIVLNIVLNNLNTTRNNLPLPFQLAGSEALTTGTYWSSNTDTSVIPGNTVTPGPDIEVIGPIVDTYNQSGATAVCPSPYVVGNNRVVTDDASTQLRTWDCVRVVTTLVRYDQGPIIGYDQVQGPPVPVFGQTGVVRNPHSADNRVSPGDCADTPGSTGVSNVVYNTQSPTITNFSGIVDNLSANPLVASCPVGSPMNVAYSVLTLTNTSNTALLTWQCSTPAQFPLITWDCPVPIISVIRYDPGVITMEPIYGPDVPVFTSTTVRVPMSGPANIPASCPFITPVVSGPVTTPGTMTTTDFIQADTVAPLGTHREWTCTATIQGVVGYVSGPDIVTTTTTINHLASVRSLINGNVTAGMQRVDSSTFLARAVRIIPIAPEAPPVGGGNLPVTVSFIANDTWVAPAGVTSVNLLGRGANTNGSTVGASSTAIGRVFPGAAIGANSPVNTVFNSVAVTPGTSYPIVVSGAGIVNITYTVGAVPPIPPVSPNGYLAITRYTGGSDGSNTFRKITTGGLIISRDFEDTFIARGNYTWTCPTGVTSISAVGVGVGSNNTTGIGGGAGALEYINNIAVVPGTTYRVNITSTGTEFIVNAARIFAGAGVGRIGGTPAGTGIGFRGGNGGNGLADNSLYGDGGGGGAAGYAGNGGSGGDAVNLAGDTGKPGAANSGAASGGANNYPGGGVGLYGIGVTGDVTNSYPNNGSNGTTRTFGTSKLAGYFGMYGNGGTNGDFSGAPGLRIVWSRPNGPIRSFPSTSVDIASSGNLEDVLIITKNLTAPNADWVWQDTVRGPSVGDVAYQALYSNLVTPSQDIGSGVVYPVLHDGYLTPTGPLLTNAVGNDYISYAFRKAPGFFDMVTYTGNGQSNRNIPHSLGAMPWLIIYKNLSVSSNWVIYAFPLSARVRSSFSTAIPVASDLTFSATEPTDLVFTVGNDTASPTNNVNVNGNNYIAYMFAHNTDLERQVRVGLYTGNGGARASIDQNFQPRFLMIKNIDVASNWYIVDTARGLATSGGTGTGNELYLESSQGEGVAGRIAYLTTNGFIPVSLANTNGQRYLYLAIR